MGSHPALLEQERCARLEAENADLRVKVAELTREISSAHEIGRVEPLCRRHGLTGSEANLMLALFDAPNRTLTLYGIMRHLYRDHPNEPDIRILDVWIHSIRKKTGYSVIETAGGKARSLSDIGVAAVESALEAIR